MNSRWTITYTGYVKVERLEVKKHTHSARVCGRAGINTALAVLKATISALATQ